MFVFGSSGAGEPEGGMSEYDRWTALPCGAAEPFKLVGFCDNDIFKCV